MRSSLLEASIVAAAEAASRNIAQATNRPPEEVRRQLSPATLWLMSELKATLDQGSAPAPVVAHEYIDRLRSQLVRELAGSDSLDGREVVRVMHLLEQLADAWKQTDRGKFMARLTGSEASSAVVAIAHDIRSPLSSILILVDSLRRGRGAVTGAIQERHLGLIYGATQGLATLVSDLIDAACGAELLTGAPRPFSIVETMCSVGAIVQPIAEEKGLHFEIEAGAADARVGHSAPLHRALLNLTSNALRYTESGAVVLGCREAGDACVEFWVQDSGRGLPAKVQETLFDAFRPEQMALRFSSSGLGLATVRAILAGMQSVLRVETSAEAGTRLSFELILPASPRS